MHELTTCPAVLVGWPPSVWGQGPCPDHQNRHFSLCRQEMRRQGDNTFISVGPAGASGVSSHVTPFFPAGVLLEMQLNQWKESTSQESSLREPEGVQQSSCGQDDDHVLVGIQLALKWREVLLTLPESGLSSFSLVPGALSWLSIRISVKNCLIHSK